MYIQLYLELKDEEAGNGGVRTIVALGLAGTFKDSHAGKSLLQIWRCCLRIRYTEGDVRGVSVPLPGQLECRNGIARAKRAAPRSRQGCWLASSQQGSCLCASS